MQYISDRLLTVALDILRFKAKSMSGSLRFGHHIISLDTPLRMYR